ncbi:MAG TPA: hypothetical protein VJO16_18285 [Candidatus Acidoferrum sp.]|nr:hypothetical protein [Candidatus Acidoferrum sp.]
MLKRSRTAADRGSTSRTGAISGGAQSLDLPQFQKMMKDLEPYIHL